MKKTLLCGIQKTGNTWVRFVIFNYFNIMNHDALKTLTWDELQKPHLLRTEKGLDYDYKDGFPLVFHTHYSYDGKGIFDVIDHMQDYFSKFDNIIYIYRNPYDTMISYWKFMMDRNTPFPFGDGIKGDALKKLETIDGFTKFYLPRFIHHVKATRQYANLILDYDRLRRLPHVLFYRVLELIHDEPVSIKILAKAIKMSSFKNIRKMSININQPYGLGGPVYRGYFCRDGQTGQYLKIMSVELIEYIKNECRKEGIEV